MKGEIKNFTGLDSPYKAPINPDIHINTLEESINESVERIINYIMDKGFVE